MATCASGHTEVDRAGSNGFLKQVKCRTCGKKLFEWWFLETVPDQIDKALEGRYVPVALLEKNKKVLHDVLEENQKLLLAKEENKTVLDDVLEEKRKLMDANIKLRKSIDKLSKDARTGEEEECWEKIHVP